MITNPMTISDIDKLVADAGEAFDGDDIQWLRTMLSKCRHALLTAQRTIEGLRADFTAMESMVAAYRTNAEAAEARASRLSDARAREVIGRSYPEDGGLKRQVRDFDDTLSVGQVIGDAMAVALRDELEKKT